jgi:hypothetical protein
MGTLEVFDPLEMPSLLDRRASVHAFRVVPDRYAFLAVPLARQLPRWFCPEKDRVRDY